MEEINTGYIVYNKDTKSAISIYELDSWTTKLNEFAVFENIEYAERAKDIATEYANDCVSYAEENSLDEQKIKEYLQKVSDCKNAEIIEIKRTILIEGVCKLCTDI